MINYDKNKELSYLKYWDIKNLYEWTNQNFNKNSNIRYFIEADVQYPEKLHELHNDLPFLPKRIKAEKTEKLVANLHDKEEHVIHIRNLKQALNHKIVLKKLHRVIKLNQKAQLKSYIGINTELKKMEKMTSKNISLT